MNFDKEKINIINTVMTLFISFLALIFSIKAYYLASLTPKFELGVMSHDGYQDNGKYKIIKNNGETQIDLYGEKYKEKFSEFNDSKDKYVIDITRPSGEIHFYIKNIGKVSAEDTKIIFEFKGMCLNPEYKENNVDKTPLEESHFIWEYKPYYPIDDYSYCEMHWVSKDILYPDLRNEFSYSFGGSIIYSKNPYIDIKIVSKTSVLQKMRIIVKYHDVSMYGKI